MKSKKEILEILKNDVISYQFVKLYTENHKYLEVNVRNIDYTQLRKLLDEILWIEPVNEKCFKLIFSGHQIKD